MALSGENSGNFDKSYFVQQGTIRSCTIAYRQASNFDANKINDIQLDLALDVVKKDGSTFEKKITISGSYQRNELDNTVTGWSSAFKVKAFFNTMLPKDKWSTDDMGVFPEKLCTSVIGMSVWVISYRAELDSENKRVYRTYKLFGRTAEEVEKRFLKDCSGDYPPYNYEPVPEEEDSTKFNYGANTAPPTDNVI